MSVQIRNPELIRLLAADFVTRRELSTTAGNRITLTNTDLSVVGGGALTLSAAGTYTLTVPKTGTVPVGTGTAGRIAEWVTDANTVQDSTLVKSGAGVLTLSAAADYTLTIPATGTAALLGTANVFTNTQLVVVDQGNAEFQAFTYRDTPSAGFFRANKARGTLASPTVLHDGDLIGGFIGNGYTGTSFVASAQISLVADGAMGSTRIPGRVELLTSDGAASATARLTIKSSGNVGINETAPTAQLQVEQTSTTAAKPTLRLQQLDLSEEFIRFDTTVGSGNPINTTALGAYYGRVRVYVEGVGAKWIALYD